MTDIVDNGMVDKIGANELGSFEQATKRGFEEHQVIHGFVTVVKNEGREDEEVLCKNKHNLLTTAGRDAMHDALYVEQVTATQLGFNIIALSVNASGADASHTFVAGEITGDGLERVDASIHTHIPTQNTSTVANTFTAGGIHTAVQLAGLFDIDTAPVSGTLGHENTFTPASLQLNDTLTVTWTLTLG
jgi:hypothetical protein